MGLRTDSETDGLLLLKSACMLGLVHLTRTEWDDLSEFDAMLMINHEIESRKESMDKPTGSKRRVAHARG